MDETNDVAKRLGLKLDARNGATFTYEDFVVSVQYLPESEMLILWTILLALGEDDNATPRAEWLLARLDGFQESNGFTYALTGADDDVMIVDRRTVDEVNSPEGLAAWVAALVDEAKAILGETEERFPYLDDDPLPDDADDAAAANGEVR